MSSFRFAESPALVTQCLLSGKDLVTRQESIIDRIYGLFRPVKPSAVNEQWFKTLNSIARDQGSFLMSISSIVDQINMAARQCGCRILVDARKCDGTGGYKQKIRDGS